MANPSSLFFLLPLVFFLISWPPPAAAAGRCHPDDESGLLAFKSGVIADPSGMLATWKPNTDCCTWSGVICGGNSSRVNMLAVSGDDALHAGSYLAGTIPLGFAKLQSLVSLRLLSLKNLTGPFPAAILGLPNLEYLEITRAQFSGPLPGDIGRRLPKLATLELPNNKFSGRLPPSLAESSQLLQLDLSGNEFVRGIPPELARLEKLNALSLDGNSLSGTIPDLSPLTQLVWLTLSHNRLTGDVPAALPPRLQTLSLAYNLLTGAVPAQLANLADLTRLDLSTNLLKGPVPPTFANLVNLTHLNLSVNSLQDPFPEMKVKNIATLDLSNNRFHLGKIPAWVESSTSIYYLGLRGCGIRTRMEDIKPLGTYDTVDLSDNEITGSIEGFVVDAGELVNIKIARNKLIFDMGRLKIYGRMLSLDISHNLVYGRLPLEIGRLDELNVSYNHLCGPIPGPNNFPASAFANNDCLCGAPLSPCHKG